MFNLKDPNISYIVVSGDVNACSNYLYSRETYQILEMSSYFQGEFDRSLFAFTNIDNTDIRRDAMSLMMHFNEDHIIVKYHGESAPTKITPDGKEHPMGVLVYNTDSEKKSYIFEGISFSFIEQQLYYFPKSKKDFKQGMVVECYSNNDWIEKRVFDVDTEYDNMYHLLIKYKKIRIPV